MQRCTNGLFGDTACGVPRALIPQRPIIIAQRFATRIQVRVAAPRSVASLQHAVTMKHRNRHWGVPTMGSTAQHEMRVIHRLKTNDGERMHSHPLTCAQQHASPHHAPPRPTTPHHAPSHTTRVQSLATFRTPHRMVRILALVRDVPRCTTKHIFAVHVVLARWYFALALITGRT